MVNHVIAKQLWEHTYDHEGCVGSLAAALSRLSAITERLSSGIGTQ